MVEKKKMFLIVLWLKMFQMCCCGKCFDCAVGTNVSNVQLNQNVFKVQLVKMFR